MPESLKNIILVMSSGGYLVPPDQNPHEEKLWVETWRRLERFLPNLRAELFPEQQPPPPQLSPQKAPPQNASGTERPVETQKSPTPPAVEPTAPAEPS